MKSGLLEIQQGGDCDVTDPGRGQECPRSLTELPAVEICCRKFLTSQQHPDPGTQPPSHHQRRFAVAMGGLGAAGAEVLLVIEGGGQAGEALGHNV